MPFIRHSRDKRGFESTYVLHAYRPAQHGPHRTRVLYVFRTPSNMRVGRKPLDSEVMEALEHTHPDLTFDWSVLQRDTMLAHAEFREAPSYRDRQRSGRSSMRPTPAAPAPQAPRPAPPPQPVPAVIELEDHTVLGEVLGAVEAARLRARYEEVLQRVSRRARSPEDRDRLTERVRRLNPDDWVDEAAIRDAAPRAETEWASVLGELPARRRGRRGGGRRPGGPIMVGDAGSASGSQHALMDGSNRASGDPDDGGGVGAATTPEPDADLPDDH